MIVTTKILLAATCKACPVRDFHKHLAIMGLDQKKLKKKLRANFHFAEGSLKSLAQISLGADGGLFDLRQILIAALKNRPPASLREDKERTRQTIADAYDGVSIPRGNPSKECAGCTGAMDSVCEDFAAAMHTQDHIDMLQNTARELKKHWMGIRPRKMNFLQKKFDLQLTQWLNGEGK